MIQLKKLLLQTREWMDDPFGRKSLLGKHEEVLGRIRETTAAVSVISNERFPMSKMVGNSDSRQGKRGANHVRPT